MLVDAKAAHPSIPKIGLAKESHAITVESAERRFATMLRSLWVSIIFFAVLQQRIHDVAHPHNHFSENDTGYTLRNICHIRLQYNLLVHLQEMRVE